MGQGHQDDGARAATVRGWLRWDKNKFCEPTPAVENGGYPTCQREASFVVAQPGRNRGARLGGARAWRGGARARARTDRKRARGRALHAHRPSAACRASFSTASIRSHRGRWTARTGRSPYRSASARSAASARRVSSSAGRDSTWRRVSMRASGALTGSAVAWLDLSQRRLRSPRRQSSRRCTGLGNFLRLSSWGRLAAWIARP